MAAMLVAPAGNHNNYAAPGATACLVHARGLGSPAMRLLDRYLLRELIVPLALCLSGFLILWISMDVLNEMERFRTAQMNSTDLVEYYLLKLPGDLPQILPVALLLALLYSLTSLARHNELIAIRCAGVSIWRMSAPFYLVGILLSGSLFAITDFVLPDSAGALRNVLTRRLPHAEKRAEIHEKFSFENQIDKRNWQAASYDKNQHLLNNASVEWELGGGRTHTIIAKRAYFTNEVWRFEVVDHWIKEFPLDTPPPITVAFLEFPEFNERPKAFEKEIQFKSFRKDQLIKKSRFPLKDILLYLEYKTDLDDEEADMIYTQLHARLAAPWTCLVVVMIAIPFASLSGKRNAFVGVASSIVFCFTYFILQRFGLALGINGALPPWLAAWGPNLGFAALGIGLAWKLK
ncbi:MAG: lipopolysaccharide export system permease protein [Candidatus Binatia bacterium]|jgi:lipopolysaccharide export system permease protein